VIAPTSVEDCFFSAIDAFNYAERYQVPVIILSDQGLATRMEVIHRPDLSEVDLWDRSTLGDVNGGEYMRYAKTSDGVSPMGIPGQPGGQYVATGIEHDEYGHPGYTPEIHSGMMRKRFQKLEPLKNGLARHVVHGDERPADIAIVGFGSTFGPVREAVDALQAQGMSVGAFYPRVLGPFPAEQVAEFAGAATHVVIPEVNYTAQLARLVRAETDLRPLSRAKCDGLPFTAEDIQDIVIEETAR
jgi:2-oxoglutarate ferredoxin oxidoreductase subunit alpha